ncbi:hypothetical protein P4L25_31285, partial [Bacillus cereus]|nr:hypothetical protein [Bacillus cereus]
IFAFLDYFIQRFTFIPEKNEVPFNYIHINLLKIVGKIKKEQISAPFYPFTIEIIESLLVT